MKIETDLDLAQGQEMSSGCEPYRVDVRPSESCDWLVLAGDINPEAAGRLRDAALGAPAPGRDIRIDWREADQVSAGALQVLLAWRAALEARGQVLLVGADNLALRRTLELAGLSRFFPVQEGRDEI